MDYTEAELAALAADYRTTLIDEVVPFWLPRSVDEELNVLLGLE